MRLATPSRQLILAAMLALVVNLAGSAVVVLTRAAPQAQSVQDESLKAQAIAVEMSGVAADPGDQPIAFSHAHHVGEYEITCEFCHAYARRGPVAGIPSVERCVGCHRSILSDQPEIQKLFGYWENEEPIPWIRIHDLPDYVRFTHKAHVRAEIACDNCHGNVAQMEVVQQTESLSMGWCLDCHKERNASRDCLTCHY